MKVYKYQGGIIHLHECYNLLRTWIQYHCFSNSTLLDFEKLEGKIDITTFILIQSLNESINFRKCVNFNAWAYFFSKNEMGFYVCPIREERVDETKRLKIASTPKPHFHEKHPFHIRTGVVDKENLALTTLHVADKPALVNSLSTQR